MKGIALVFVNEEAHCGPYNEIVKYFTNKCKQCSLDAENTQD